MVGPCVGGCENPLTRFWAATDGPATFEENPRNGHGHIRSAQNLVSGAQGFRRVSEELSCSLLSFRVQGPGARPGGPLALQGGKVLVVLGEITAARNLCA